jgi:hypothetical protein
MLMVNPADYANIPNQYPIVAVSNLIANEKGNGTDVTAVRSLFSSLYGTSAAAHPGVTTIGTGTGYAFVNAAVAAARVNACINS